MRPGRIGAVAERLRVVAFVVGCGLLFWQRDAAPADWLFAAGVIASACIWERAAPAFDLATPQPLLLLFLTITASATILADGSPRSFMIAAALVTLTMALASTLKRQPGSIRAIAIAVAVAGGLAALTLFAGAMAGVSGAGLFKSADIAGAFVACSYPLAVASGSGLRRLRGAFLALTTAMFGIGVVFSYSPWALCLMALAVVGVMLALAISGERRLLFALAASVVLLGGGIAAAGGGFAPYARHIAQGFEQGGEFPAWRVGAQLFVDAPLGTGAGSFEPRANELFAAGHDRWPAADFDQSPNLLRNGAPNGLTGWTYDPTAVAVGSDPTSVTGTATRKHTTAIYQDLAQSVAVTGGQTYSFAAQIRTDGTPAFLIVHWRDANDSTIAQAASDAVDATTWTESRLQAQSAPPVATTATVFLSNGAPGDQYFAAVRMVEGGTAPAWSSSMEWGAAEATAAHSTYLRLAVESGLPGVLTLGAYWLLLARSAWRRGRTPWHWALALTVALLAGVAIDTLDWRVVWVYAGVVAAALSERRTGDVGTRRKAPAPSRLSQSPSISE